ncbi:Coiled-coil domain-containing protein 130 homolog [Gryllus bimaculatus]|nr:Coiled-coil domain-containing protein 130 homolog [Gryllus bimaculatus]
MGERKGTNLYYPPDYDPKKGGLNKFLGTHALRERARKLHLGILIIRFEMPYNIWCDGCGNHIGMGVRYNAEKKKVGMYYSTPVYQFRMKCHLCDNYFEIKTDPANLDYIIVSGARRQENRWDPTQNGQVVPEDKNTQKRLFDDSMFKLEHGVKDETKAKTATSAARRLLVQRDQLWQDDFSANSALRAKFRATKKAAVAQEAKDKHTTSKFGLDISLLPENDVDRKMASLLALKPSKSMAERNMQAREDILNTPVLPNSSTVSPNVITKRSRMLENDAVSLLGIVHRKRPRLQAETLTQASSEETASEVADENEIKDATPQSPQPSKNSSLSLVSDCYDSNSD